jgi:hypothetical protein
VAVILLPNSELVAIAWISSIQGLQVDGVATQLPADEATWNTYGFITVAVIGGNPNPDMNLRKPTFQVDCWANNPGSDKVPWWRANALAEQVRAATYDRVRLHRGVTITAGGKAYPNVIVDAVTMLTEPRRGYGDPGDYARYSLDLQMIWAQVGESDP